MGRMKWGRYCVLCLVMVTVILKLQMGIREAAGMQTAGQPVLAENTGGDAEESGSGGENIKTGPGNSSQDQMEQELEKQTEPDIQIEPSQEVSSDTGYTILGQTGVTREQMAALFHQSGYPYPSEVLGPGGAPTIEDYCQIYLEEAAVEGVKAEIPFAQSMIETGWLQFQGVCDAAQYNFAGIGATGGDEPGESYADVRTGIRAQVQHLKAYATADPLNEVCVDTRYAYVRKASAPYVQWLGQQENPEGCGWATAAGYGNSIANMIQNLKSF